MPPPEDVVQMPADKDSDVAAHGYSLRNLFIPVPNISIVSQKPSSITAREYPLYRFNAIRPATMTVAATKLDSPHAMLVFGGDF